MNTGKQKKVCHIKRWPAALKIMFILVIGFTLMFSVTGCGSSGETEDDYVENEIDLSYDKDREALDTDQLGNTILL